MNDDRDHALLRAFAQQAPPSPEEAFVRQVSARVETQRRLSAAARWMGALAAVLALPWIAAALGWAAGRTADTVAAPFAVMRDLPAWPAAAAALALALSVCALAVAAPFRR